MPLFSSRRPTIWTCRRLAEYTEQELRLATLIFGVIGRGDFYLA